MTESAIAFREYHTAEPILRVENVSKSFGDKLVLRDVNFEIRDVVRPGMQQGQVWSFLGKSGAGKTTLAKIIAGIEAPTTGEILVQPENRPVKRGEVGFVFQNYISFPHLTVEKNLLVAAYQGTFREHADIHKPQDLPRRLYTYFFARKVLWEKVEQYLDMFGMRDHLDQYPSELSGGQQQRLAILMQLLCSSRYIVLDEPFSGQDPEMKQRACEMLIKIAQLDELETLLVITHDIDSALWISDTLLLVGREPDPANPGKPLPGSTVYKPYSLAERGLAWQDASICRTKEFSELLQEVKYDWFPKM